MISSPNRPSQPHHAGQPRPPLDAQLRYQYYGKVRPMDEPSFLQRIFGRR